MTAMFSERLKAARLATGLNKAKMAKTLGFSPQRYQRYEEGRIPDAVTLDVIAKRLGVTVDYLLCRDGLPVDAPFKPSSRDTSPPGTVRESPSPYGSDAAQMSATVAHLAKSCAELGARMSNIEQLLLALLAEQRSKNAEQTLLKKDAPP